MADRLFKFCSTNRAPGFCLPFLGCILVAPAFVLAQERGAHAVDQIVVTGYREERLAEIPRSASVISADDLTRLPGNNLVDYLARQPNLNLRATLASEKFSGVDIRGQGDTYTSNVLWLVDGFRLNAEDLSGADLSTVAVDNIRQIDVIRGANTVRYGNGAVAGVINIVTRDVQPGTEVRVRGRVGSYETVDAGADLAWSNDSVWTALGGSHYDSNGYRDNGGLEKTDFSAAAGVQLLDSFSASLHLNFHEDEFGLPGPRSSEEFFGSATDRQGTQFPFASGRTDDNRYRAEFDIGDKDTGILTARLFRRDRDNPFRFGADAPDDPFDDIAEDSARYELQYSKDFEWLSRDHALFAGVVGDDVDYVRTTRNTVGDIAETQRGNINHRAWFLAADFGLTANLMLSVGFREDQFQIDRLNAQRVTDLCADLVVIGAPPNQVTFCNDPGGFSAGFETESQRDTYRNDAYEVGLVYTTENGSNWFIAFATSFRNPNVDELALSAENLRPQTGDHLDAGVRSVWSRSLESSVAIFWNETDDEILFGLDPFSAPQNINAFEPIKRTGGEADFSWRVADDLELSGYLGYTRARFKNTAAAVPLVPEWTAGLTVEAYITDAAGLTVTSRYVGSRFEGNDFNNTEDKVDSYATVDAQFTYALNQISLFVGISNLFDEVYAPSVYSSNYYPAPERNFYAGFRYQIQST